MLSSNKYFHVFKYCFYNLKKDQMEDKKSYKRLLNKEHKPDKAEILKTLGNTTGAAWNDLQEFLGTYYDFVPETKFYASKYGWTVRYRRSGKTLCSLFPEGGAFSVLLVLGAKEAGNAMLILNEFSAGLQKIIMDTEQFHDGRWLWIRVLAIDDIDDIKKLIKIKKKPKTI